METEQERSPAAADATGASPEVGSTRLGGDEELSGLIRRVRRLAKLSQRDLAHALGVSQSAVAKWETKRTTPSARMLTRILKVAELSLVAVRRDGERALPMKPVAARDAAGRRYPAHTFVWADGWWAPVGAETTAYFSQILGRSSDLQLPRVRYSPWWQGSRLPSLADIDDHPTWGELVAEAKEGWQPPRHRVLPIPEWAYQDSRKSRNRRPDEFRVSARVVGGWPAGRQVRLSGGEAIRYAAGQQEHDRLATRSGPLTS